MNNKPIKVLQMVASLSMGGSQSMIINLYKAIDKNRVQFDFVIDHPELDVLRPIVEEMGCKIYEMPTFTGNNIKEVKKAWNDLFKEHPEYKIIHSHARSYASIYLPIAKKYGLKTIIHSHNTSNGKTIKSYIKDILQLPLRHIADYFFSCSLNAGKWLFGKRVVQSDKFFVINNAIDISKFEYNEAIRNEYRKQFDLKDERVFIQVGSFTYQKNYLFTLELFSKYYENDKNAKLFLVGDGPLKKDIVDLINKYDITNNVKILSGRNDVNKLLQMSDVYLMPSNYEGLSVATVEAQASGIKCLLSDKVSKDVEISGVCEFLPLDIEIWLNRIKNISTTRVDTKNDIIRNGFDVNTTAEWLCEFYERLV